MDTMSASTIYKVLYLFLNVLFTIYEVIVHISINLNSKLLELCHEFLPANKSNNFQKFDKIPTHLTVLLGAEEPSYGDLANVILWCLAAQITFVSFYDYTGTLQRHQEKLHQMVQEKTKASDHVIWYNSPGSFHKNGFVGRKIHVKVLSMRDGRRGVAGLTKKLAFSKETSTISSFEHELKKQFEFPDPELGVCSGKAFSLYSYPPWQIRLTEFLTINSHHNFTLDTFVKLLSVYNRCEQRYGK